MPCDNANRCGHYKGVIHVYSGKIYAGKERGKIRYIGQTQMKIAERIKLHIKRYPERQRWSWQIIERIQDASIFNLWRRLDAAERFYIRKHNTLHPLGENKEIGGVKAEYRLAWIEKNYPDL